LWSANHANFRQFFIRENSRHSPLNNFYLRKLFTNSSGVVMAVPTLPTTMPAA
jgi:hypothetical protein